MSDELRQLATAIKALAESNQGLGGLVRELVSQQGETNRVLGSIHEQLAGVGEYMTKSDERHADSERMIRVVQSDIRHLKATVQVHGQRIEENSAALRASKAQ